MSATVRSNWFWSDWLGDLAVRRLTPAERGIWIDLIGLAAFGHPRGFVTNDRSEPIPMDEIARLANCTEKEVVRLVDNIVRKGAASRGSNGIIYCRRIVKEAEISAKRSLAGAIGGEALRRKYFNGINGSSHDLPRQLPEHLPRPLPSQSGIPIPDPLSLSSLSEPQRQNGSAERGLPRKQVSASLERSVKAKGWVAR